MPLQECVPYFGRGDVVVFPVSAVGVEAIFDDLDFLFCEKGAAGFVDFVGKVDDDEVADSGECDWDETFDDELSL